jgi:glycosyltransferase involved in cell wall biosynthesis
LSIKRKLIAVQPNAELTGSPQSLFVMCSLLRERGYQFDIYFLRDGPVIERFVKSGFFVQAYDSEKIFLRFYSFVKIFLEARRQKDSYILLNTMASLRNIALAIFFRNRSVVYVREFPEMLGRMKFVKIFLLRFCRHLISLTNANRDWLVNEAKIGGKIYVIGNFVEHSKIKILEQASQHEVVLIGKIDYRKGLDFFLDVLERSNLKGRIVGDLVREKLNNNDLNRIETLLYSGDLVITGFRDDISAELGNALVYVCLSRSEVFSRSILECQALGIPCIAWNLPTNRELLPANNQFALGDVEGVVDRIEKIRSSVITEKLLANDFVLRFSEHEFERNFVAMISDIS